VIASISMNPFSLALHHFLHRICLGHLEHHR
jgi:hypothetical protein